MTLSVTISGQSDFITMDKRSYDYYLDCDYRNLKKTADTMISSGMDYYYLRMRLGIVAYIKRQYPDAVNNFSKALEFNSLDTVSHEYIYNSYILSGRRTDAKLFLGSLPDEKKNSNLRAIRKNSLMEFYLSSSFASYEGSPLEINDHYFEDIDHTLSIHAGLESFLSERVKGTFAFTNYRKTGTIYLIDSPSGTNLDFTQNQFYTRVSGYSLKGWVFSGFGHALIYTDASTNNRVKPEFLFGAGVLKNSWKIRAAGNFSLSNFSFSRQIRGEAYLTWLPFGNLNLYITTGWMGQTDRNWGGTYQVNGEIGFKAFKYLWLESGIINGNSFLYARDFALTLNNSFLIPETTIYGNVIILAGKRLSLTVSPCYSENLNYSWNLNSYTRFNKQYTSSFGGIIKLTYKSK